MPLPTSDPNAAWPPKSLDQILPAMGQWSAWWTNSLERLQIAYGGGTTGDTSGFFQSDTGGRKVHSLGPIRWFVGQSGTSGERNTKLPIPIAAEMCQASADLLFSDPVTVTVTDKTTQARLTVLLDDFFHSTMAEGAESAAALGGVYLRATWDDKAFDDRPFTTIKDADTAVPEFKWGRLVAVTFWTVVHRDGKYVFRHLERHELRDGNGVILHGLYMGEDDKLGTRLGLATRPETAPLAIHADLEAEGTIDTRSEGLAVTYVPNQTPNRMWRTHEIGRHLGRSDLDGVEHLLDQLAETMSDWMRARRAARARTWVAKDLTKSGGPGQGTSVDLDKEVYTQVRGAGGNGGLDSKLSDQIHVTQPDFAPDQYKVTVDALIEQILQMAGYSMQTFGVHPDGGGEQTATEIESKERRSLMTRARKIRAWNPALQAHITKLLDIDRVFFGSQNNVNGLAIEFSDGVQESQIKLGQFVQSLYNAESASVEERVEILHPDWEDDQKSKEVERIKAEFAHAPLDDPAMPPFDPNEKPTDEKPVVD